MCYFDTFISNIANEVTSPYTISTILLSIFIILLVYKFAPLSNNNPITPVPSP